jgi:beta-lactamase class A
MLTRFLLAGACALAACSAQAQHSALRTTIAQLASAAPAKVGVALRVLETNDTLSYHNRQPYPMLSVFKLALAMQVLHEVDRGRWPLTQSVLLTKADLTDSTSPLAKQYPAGNVRLSVQELLTAMVTVSDNNACDKLLQLAGGPAELTAYVRQLGIKPFAVEVSEAQMAAGWANQYRNWSYPSAQVNLLSHVYRQTALSKASSKLLWQLLLATSVGPKRLKGLLPVGTPVAHRTGTSATNAQGLSPALNDVGVILLPNGQHVALAVFVTDSYAGTAARKLVIATIAKAVYDEFARTP